MAIISLFWIGAPMAGFKVAKAYGSRGLWSFLTLQVFALILLWYSVGRLWQPEYYEQIVLSYTLFAAAWFGALLGLFGAVLGLDVHVDKG